MSNPQEQSPRAMTQNKLEARALIAGDLLRDGEVERVECFRMEMDAALGQNSGEMQFKKNKDWQNGDM